VNQPFTTQAKRLLLNGHTFSDGSVVTIYDWKRYDLGAPDMDEIMEYNIGGFNKDAAEKVKMAVLLGTSMV
jgi:hypothetical protein